MNRGDTVELKIESFAFGGDAIARHEGWVIFLQGALPGETVSAEITEKRAKFYKAKLLKVLKPSPHRVKSPCPYFSECGGCQYLHVSYEGQLEAKKKQIEDLFTRLGKIASPPIKVLGSPEPLHYRNRVKMHLLKRDKKVLLGFKGATGKGLVQVDHCMIANKTINENLTPIAGQLQKLRRARTVHIRSNAEGKVDFWTDKLALSKGTTLMEKVRGKAFETPSGAFFQVNPAMTDTLTREVESFLDKDSQVLIDAYCGVGLFSVLFADKFQAVLGIEQDQDSIRWARKNMRAYGITSGIFYEGSVESNLERALANNPDKKHSVILDPPRDGLHRDAVRALCRKKIHQIIYVSCNPSTLARDLGLLSSTYKLLGVTLVDMFPQTMHSEVIACLKPAL
jgi:23S rRNA (uracil1939-C5)-methyltransferase